MQHSHCLLLLCALLITFKASGQFDQNINLYNQIKDLENSTPGSFPISKIDMGTYNGSNNDFTGLRSTVSMVKKIDNSIPGCPKPCYVTEKVTVPPTIQTELGLFTELTFHFTNLNSIFSAFLTVAGVKYEIKAHSTVFVVRMETVQGERNIPWSIQYTSNNITESLTLRQFGNPSAAAGGFTIPYLPISIVYQPDMDLRKKNFASYEQTSGIGTLLSMGLEENNTSTPAAYNNKENIIRGLKLASNALSGNPLGQALGGIAKVMEGMGSYSVQQETGLTQSQTAEFAALSTESLSISSTPLDGLGNDDLFYFRKNVRLIWYLENGHFSILPVADEGSAIMRAATLKAQYEQLKTTNAAKAEDLKNMLKLDPFVFAITLPTQPSITLPADRFTKMQEFQVNGTDDLKYTFSNQSIQLNTQSTASYTLTTEDYKAGWLHYVGIGVDESKTVQTRMTHSSSTANEASKTVAATIHVFAGPTETYTIGVYYDNVFRTFVAKRETTPDNILVEGMVSNSMGRAMPNKVIVFKDASGKQISTNTNASGRFYIRSSSTKGSKVQLQIGGRVVKEVDYKGQTVKNVNITL